MSNFCLNFFCLSGHLGADPVRAPNISPTAVHFRLMVRNPFAPDSNDYKEKYFYPLDLYAKGQQGDLLLNHYKKGSYVTVFGSIISERISVRGKAEGIAKLMVEGVDVKYYIPHVPTAEELGFRPATYKNKPAPEETPEDDTEAAPKKKKSKKPDFLY